MHEIREHHESDFNEGLYLSLQSCPPFVPLRVLVWQSCPKCRLRMFKKMLLANKLECQISLFLRKDMP